MVKRINFLSSFSESAEKAALKKTTKQKEKDLGVLMWTGPQRPGISVLVTKKIILQGLRKFCHIFGP